jgi:TolB-like protein/Flp pilus assembly protein TadD
VGTSKLPGRGESIRLGELVIDLRARAVYVANRRIKLQDLPFNILQVLAGEPGSVVTREDLRQRLWPTGTSVDFEAGLNTAIRKLRRAVGDTAKNPRFIETVPRRGYRLIVPTVPSRKHSSPIDSIAVLPFQNDSAVSEHDYLAEGITEALISGLSEVPAIRKVIARNSVFRYKGREIEPQSIARDLDVRGLVIGKVAHAARKLAITVELVDSADERRLWAKSYETTLSALQHVQNDIVAEIAGTLQDKAGSRTARRTPLYTTGLDVYNLYLRGRYWWNKRPLEGAVLKAISFFEQATKNDPDFALPYVGLADSYNTLAAWESGAMAPNIAFPKAQRAASQALDRNATLAEAHTSLAYGSLHFEWRWEQAEAQFKKALRLNPKYSHAHHWYSHYLTAVGRRQESFLESLAALELDPLDLIINIHLAWHYLMFHAYTAALEQSRAVLEMEPTFHWGYFFSGLAHQQLGATRDAIADLEKAVQLSGGPTVMLSALGHAYAVGGQADRAFETLAKLRELSSSRYVSSSEVALIHCALGETDRAFEYLEQAYSERSGWLAYLNVEPRIDRLYRDPRFKKLLARIGLAHQPARP